MRLRETILIDHSKANSLKIVDWVGTDKARFAELFRLFLGNEYRVTQRASWTISTIAERHPELIMPYLPIMVERIQQDGVPEAVKRNVLRILQFVPLPEELHGSLINICFSLLEAPKEAVAVRVFAMTVLGRLTNIYPELKEELRLIIREVSEQDPTPAFKARAKAVLKAIA